ncbi:MAG: flavodoxin family protein [Deltaproteobacteria bacterium]|nr:flavodoxin family protein [Deltaproteobacteria bacterium]
MTIPGISSSPVEYGNLSFSPCRACAHLCAKDNLCKLEDDLKPVYPRLIETEAIVLGTPCYLGNMLSFVNRQNLSNLHTILRMAESS